MGPSTIVSRLEFIQHLNGITRVEGFIGNDLAAMPSIAAGHSGLKGNDRRENGRIGCGT